MTQATTKKRPREHVATTRAFVLKQALSCYVLLLQTAIRSTMLF